MKKLITASILIVSQIIINSHAFAQDVFTIIDIKKIKENYNIVTARQESNGRTIQFQVGNGDPRMAETIKKYLKVLPLGSKVIPNSSSVTVKAANIKDFNKVLTFKLVQPSLNQCCLVEKINTQDISYQVQVKMLNTNERLEFWIGPQEAGQSYLQLNSPIYQDFFNNIKYAILRIPGDDFITFSYNLYSLNNTSTRNDNPIIETNQWEIATEITNTAGIPDITIGRVKFNIQDNAEFSIKIYYNSAILYSSKSESSYTYQFGSNPILLQTDVEISGITLKNIPIHPAKITRIKTGALNIISSSPWSLYDSSKINTVYTSTVPKIVEFPVGIYQLEINGNSQQIEIKDGQTLQYGDSSQAPQTQKLNKSYQPWEIKPDLTIKGMGGEVTLEIPKGLRYNTNLEFFNAGEKTNRQASWFGNNKAKLLPGMYDVVIDSRDTIKNVPVELGKQTRLKMGVFMVSGYSDANLENSTTHQKFTYGAPFKILLPEGTYYLNKNKKVPIVIKDGELTEL